MATARCLMSWRVADESGATKSFQEYGTFDDATATLASLKAAMDLRTNDLDTVTDGKIEASSFVIYFDLPVGLKADAAVGSDVEETALYTFITSAPGGKVYSSDIPAGAQDNFVGKSIDEAAEHAALFITHQCSAAGTIRNTDEKWAYTLDTFKRGLKKFRK